MRVCIFLFLLVLTSCNSLTTKIDDFDIVEEITSYDSIYSDKENPFGMITDMNIQNNVIVTSHRVDEYKYSFIDVSSGSLLTRWGKKGNAPDDFLDFGNGFILNDSLLIFLDRMKKTINYVSCQDILNKKDSLRIIREKYPYITDFRPMQLCLVNGYKIFAGAFKDGLFGAINPHDSILNNTISYPFSVKPIEGIYRGNVFQSKIKSCSGSNRFVVQFLSSDVFEIFQIDDTIISQVATSSFSNPPVFTQVNGRYGLDYNKCIAGFMHMVVSKDLIYFLYSSLGDNDVESSNEILCFNWNGEKEKKYILPFPINIFCVDDVYIYGAREYDDETVIYRFRL